MSAVFLITTTGTLSPISFPDMGTRDFVHPVVDLDLIHAEGFTLEECRDSADIAAALDAGHITVKDANGNVIVDSGGLDDIPTDHILGSHSDVTIIGLADKDVLSWDATAGQWGPSPRAGAGGVTYNDVLDYGHSSSAKGKFLKWSGTHHKSSDSTALALYAGEIVHVALSTEKDPGNNWFLQIIKNATKDGAGVFQGGTQISADLEKTAGALDKTYRDLTGYTFAQDDRLSCYVKEGTLGGKDAKAPVVRLFVRYTAS